MEIKIKLEPGIKNNDISLIQAVEKDLDKTMVAYGFTRSTTSKTDDKVEFNYIQFGTCEDQTDYGDKQ